MKTKNETTEVNRLSVIILRIMLSLIFIVASLNHFLETEKIVSRIEGARFSAVGNLLGSPEIAVVISGIAMMLGGLALLLGFRTRLAALVLIVVLIPITLTIQIGQMSTLGPLFKNIAILGGLFFFSINSFNKNPK